MGSEVFGSARPGGVADGDGGEVSRDSVFIGPRMNNCSALVGDRDSVRNVHALEPSSWVNRADTQFEFSNLLKDDMPPELYHGAMSNSLGLVAGSEGKQLQKKVGRVPRSSPGCFKRPRTPQQETSSSPSTDLGVKDASYKLGSRTIKFFYADKSQPVKIGKRGERRNSKVPQKAKHDAYSLRAGLLGFNQTPGGNNVFGTYGLKSEVHDITKFIYDNISLNELLAGTYKCPTASKEKDKKPANTNENILQSVRKAFSILRGPSQVKQYDDIDAAVTKKIPLLSSTSNLPPASSVDGAEENSLASELSSCMKVQEACVNAEVLPHSRDPLPYHPKDILEKLSLPRRKDLDCLGQDAAKLAASSRHNDPSLSKPMSHEFKLRPFSWSHNYSGHSKSNPDSVKASNRSSCQGRWVRIGNTASFLGSGSKCCTDIGDLAYDQDLVPAGSVKYILLETGSSLSKTANPPVGEEASSSAVSLMLSQTPPVAAWHSPRALAAAQTLYYIARDTTGIIKWPTQPSQKAMKARKTKLIENPANLLAPKSETKLGKADRSMDFATPLKKHKFSITQKDHSVHDNAPRAPHYWSAPRSSRSSPIRTSRDLAPDANKHHTSRSFPKPTTMAPTSPRVLEKTNYSQLKPLKVLHKDWNRGKS